MGILMAEMVRRLRAGTSAIELAIRRRNPEEGSLSVTIVNYVPFVPLRVKIRMRTTACSRRRIM
jgi:hypothetical protein